MKPISITRFTYAFLISLFVICCGEPPDSDNAQIIDIQNIKPPYRSTDSTEIVVSRFDSSNTVIDTIEYQESQNPISVKHYFIDIESSEIAWIGTKSTGRHNGIVKLRNGFLLLLNNDIVGGEFTIDMHSIEAIDSDEENNTKLVGHLKSADFFNVDSYPTATFVISRVIPVSNYVTEDIEEIQDVMNDYKVSNPTHTVVGNLTICNITRGLSFPAKITLTENSVSATSKFNINRKDWNLNWEIPVAEIVLNNTIHLEINIISLEN